MIDRIHKMIKRSTKPPQSLVHLLKKTLIGTEGSLYQLLDTEKKIYQLHQATHVYLERNEKVIGNITFCKREINHSNINCTAHYLRYVAFDSVFQGDGTKGKASSTIHTYFKSLFETSNFNPKEPEHFRSIYWAYIDPQNLRSFRLNENFGFQTIGSFKTIAFSRVNPSEKKVEKIAEIDKHEVLNIVRDFYKDFQFFSDTHIFDNDDYYILRHNGEIVAGIQANPVHWRIKSLPGASGKLLIHLAPFIPRIRKLINPKNHKFLATEGLFWKNGHQDKVQDLLEGVLAYTKQNSMLLWVDTNNSMLDTLNIKWGFIQKTKKDNHIHIVAKFNQFEADEIQSICDSKKYLSGFDMT